MEELRNIEKTCTEPLAISSVFPFCTFFYCDYFAGKLPLGKKNYEKSGQKIPEMVILKEFVGNPRNSSQGIMT